MKVLIISAKDLGGGAARAAYRLHQGLLTAQIDSQMLVQNKQGDDNTVIAPKSKSARGIAAIKPALDQLPLALYRQRDPTINIYSSSWLPNRIFKKITEIKPDIINLHWVCGGLLPIEVIGKLKQPVVWTLHDMWAFTGGCHYNGECDHYQNACGACPQLGSSHNWDLSRWNWRRKAKSWQDLNLTVVTPSKWLASRAQSSSLFKNVLKNVPVQVIGNGINPQIYQPHPTQFARQVLNLPRDKKIVLFGAFDSTQDKRKGFGLLLAALKKLRQLESTGYPSDYSRDSLELVIFGSSAPVKPIDFGFKTHYTGKLNDDVSLSLLYSAADVFIAPSVQDNLPNTVLEAMFCGTPCAAFKIGGMPDLIDHQQSGYLAEAFVPEDLGWGIHWILTDDKRCQALGAASRAKAIANFALSAKTQEYLRVFTELCSKVAI